MTDLPIELFVSPTPNAFKVLIGLEECRLSYTLRPVDVWKGQQFEDWFVALNPNSKVPVLVDPQGPEGGSHTVIESCAILLYLAEKTGIGLPTAPVDRSNVLQWLIFQAANLGPMSGQLNHFVLYAPKDQEYGRSRYITEVRRLYGVLDRVLAKAPFVGSGDFSIADAAIYPWMFNLDSRHGKSLPFLAAASDEHPRLADWFARCAARPGVKRAQEAFINIRSTLANATPDELDRIFGRNAYARAT